MFNLANLLTLLNLLSGCLAILSLFQGADNKILLFFGAALLFDLADGLVARKFNLSSSLGAELDSLADMVSFGVFPGLLLFTLIQHTDGVAQERLFPAVLGLIYTAAACLRLAKFNTDTRQTTDFLGLNTPAAAIAILGLYLNSAYGQCVEILTIFSQNMILVLILILVLSVLLLVDLPMLSFKPTLSDRRRTIDQIILIAGFAIILAMWWTCALPFLILWYILFSLIKFILLKNRR